MARARFRARRFCSIVLILLSTFPVFADRQRGARGDRAHTRAAVTGVVATVSGNLVTIMNGSVTIDTTGARFESRGGGASIADVKPGSRIHAAIGNADAAPGATLHAVVVAILDAPDGSLFGPVTAIDPVRATLTVLGATIQVTSATIIGSGRDAPPGTLADIKVGDSVAVDVEVTSSGLTAERIHILPPKPNAAVDGVVKSIAPDRWVITRRDGSEVTVLVNAQTRIDPNAKVGSTVHVIGNSDAAGNIVALSIGVASQKPGVTLEGIVKSIAPDAWVITTREGGVRVAVTAETRIDSALKVGDAVHVAGNADSSGAITARSITAARPNPPSDNVRFEGVVKAISASEWLVDTIKVLVRRETKIIGSPLVGDRVRVTGRRGSDGVFVAASIEKL